MSMNQDELEVVKQEMARDTKGTHFMQRWAHSKGENSKDLTEVADIKTGGKKIQKNYTRKIFMTQITMMV